MLYFLAEIYTSEKSGCDEIGTGDSEKPFKNVQKALQKAGKEPWPTIYVDSKEDGKVIVNYNLNLMF